MNILKHMEAVFVATVALAVSGAYMLDALPQAHTKAGTATQASTQMPAIVVSAKRMSAEEKRQSLQAERSEAGKLAAAHKPASRI